VGELVRW